MKMDPALEQFITTFQRPRDRGPIRGVLGHDPGRRRAMSLQPDELDRALLVLGEIAAALPQGALSAQRRRVWRRLCYPAIGTVLREHASALRQAELLMGGLQGAPSSVAMTALANRIAAYASLKRCGQRGLHHLLDLRLLLGGFQAYVLRALLKAVVARLEDPQAGEDDKHKLTNAFMGLLTHKERLLVQAAERRGQRDEAEVKRAERQLQMLDVARALRAGQQPDPVALAEAAIFFHEEQLPQRRVHRAQGAQIGGVQLQLR